MLEIGVLPSEKLQLPRLDSLAELANAAHAACEQAQKAAAINGRDCGNVLIEAKSKVPHESCVPVDDRGSAPISGQLLLSGFRCTEVGLAANEGLSCDQWEQAGHQLLKRVADDALARNHRPV